jgi:hypothetical protein
MKILDTESYPSTEQPGRCLCCSKELVAVTGPASYRQHFRSTTGMKWPGAISLNLHRDFESLGLDADNVPGRATLCLVCAVDYMTEFNARNSRRRGRPDHGVPQRGVSR